MGSIKVSLNTAVTPALSVYPMKHEVNPGNDTIRWIESPTSPTKGFTFTSLTFSGNPTCFEDQVVCPKQISVDDDNTGPNEYPYTLVVTYNNKTYSTGGQIGGDPGGPTIKNK